MKVWHKHNTAITQINFFILLDFKFVNHSGVHNIRTFDTDILVTATVLFDQLYHQYLIVRDGELW
ncbi:hypothetical protein CCYN2B_460003 [Capnocytophaga cynodegmi]|uniref:Uncharacterized protein n=1 Tax=Capnocytophaga cynodegmi TaxID=28189 RepID=A0A0B7HL25_9FLAO|nr:hypothetical protein CCYN2B_460003 [Capnocytophaga cynodegmi]